MKKAKRQTTLIQTSRPTAPPKADAVTLSATVRNAGGVASAASNVNFYLGTTKVGTANVGALAAGSLVAALIIALNGWLLLGLVSG